MSQPTPAPVPVPRVTVVVRVPFAGSPPVGTTFNVPFTPSVAAWIACGLVGRVA